MLKGKKILLGVSGSIAAYKTTTLTRLLVKAGADVRIVMTPSALSFITPLTLSTLSKNPVYSAYVTDEEKGVWTNHVELGKWADLMLIAPLSANTLSKMVCGECDNLLMAVYLSATCPVMVAPAMDMDMAEHWTTLQNLEQLANKDCKILSFADGELASGYTGKGRMQEPEDIFKAVIEFLVPSTNLRGKHIIITAGPTHEAIDPVRYIGNNSSGKMGFALAETAAEMGAYVTLISGPTYLDTPSGVKRIDIVSAEQLFEQVKMNFGGADILIMAAAVADYRPKEVAEEKLKKEKQALNTIELVETTDILAYCGNTKKHQRLVGFALETNDELNNARKKLKNKKLDMLVLNSLRDEGAGFGTDTNKVTFVFPDREKFGELVSKKTVAKDILNEVDAFY
ncbi:MAG: bifunctional phosphopantothenoylcysteine decarboxylase/phosphopantothenate--cysteine ligase CoaBC [Salibacteraceae bacterium]